MVCVTQIIPPTAASVAFVPPPPTFDESTQLPPTFDVSTQLPSTFHVPTLPPPAFDVSTLKLNRTSQVVALNLLDDVDSLESGKSRRVEAPILSAAPLPGPDSMVSAAILAQKAKRFDDGLMAAVELAAQRGAGRFAGKTAMLAALSAQLAKSAPNSAATTVLAAATAGGIRVPALSAAQQQAVRARMAKFDQNPLLSLPTSFYSWSPELRQIFRQDRLLQTQFEPAADGAVVAQALSVDRVAGSTYADYLALTERMTARLAWQDLRPNVAALRIGQPKPLYAHVSFLPASRSAESDLLERLYPVDAPPAGYALVDDLAQRIRKGDIDLQPTATSGWYDHQLWALSGLVTPERNPEASRLKLDDKYRAALVDLFRSLLAQQRETHTKQLENRAYPAAALVTLDQIVTVSPKLRVEPLPTYYQRRAASYRFVRRVLADSFGEATLKQLYRLSPAGKAQQPLAVELQDMEALFQGAYLASAQDLGMTPQETPSDAAALQRFLDWRAHLANDADIKGDQRMMVPLFYDAERKQVKVLAFLGWDVRPLRVSFAKPPVAQAVPNNVHVKFASDDENLVYPVTTEIYVDKVLDRAEFQALCNKERTRTEIVRALTEPKPVWRKWW